MYNEARKRATNNYLRNKARITLTMSAEEKSIIEAKAKSAGKSLNAYIIDKAKGGD